MFYSLLRHAQAWKTGRSVYSFWTVHIAACVRRTVKASHHPEWDVGERLLAGMSSKNKKKKANRA